MNCSAYPDEVHYCLGKKSNGQPCVTARPVTVRFEHVRGRGGPAGEGYASHLESHYPQVIRNRIQEAQGHLHSSLSIQEPATDASPCQR